MEQAKIQIFFRTGLYGNLFYLILTNFAKNQNYIYLSQQKISNLRIFEMKKQKRQEISEHLLAKPQQSQTKIESSVQEKKTPPSSFLSLFSYTTGPEKFLLIIGSISAIIAGAAFPYFLLFFGNVTTIFDDTKRDTAGQRGWDLCWKFFIIGGVTWIGRNYFIGNYCWNLVGSAQSVRLKKLYYKLLLEQEVQWYDENDPHKIVTKVATSITAIETATGEKISLLLTTLVTSVASIFFAFFKCWELSLMMMAALPALILGGVFFMKAMVLYSQRQKVAYESAASRTQQALGQIRTVKGLNGQAYQMSIFKEALDKGSSKAVKYNLYRAMSNGLIMIIFLSLYSFGFWYGKNLIIDNITTDKYSAGTIISAFFCFLIGGSSVGQISPFFKNIADGRVAMAEFMDLLNRKKTLVEPTNGIKLDKIKNIVLEDINFAYKQDQPVLQNVCIQFASGKVSALVGESGCGKSTIVQLLLRYYDTKSGNILVNDTKITEIDMDSFRQKIGFVGQEPVLFAMSIAENLKLANPTISEEEMIQILKKANAWEFVQKMENGLNTYVGSGGTQLSGGQKQRIAIARALCKKPQILILDEATSALDRKNEKQIQQTLRNLQKNQITTIVIAHRLSTIKNADCIYVLSKGKLVEKGTHDDLINKNGLYSDLVKTQIAAQKHMQTDIKAPQQIQRIKQAQEDATLATSELTQKIEPSKQKQDAVFKKLFQIEKNNKHLLIIGAITALLAGGIWPLFNYLFSGIMSFLISPLENQAILNEYCLYMEIVAVGGGIMFTLFTFSFGLASERLVYTVRMKLFDKLLRMPLSYFDRKENTAGAISIKLATDAFQLNNMISGVLGVMCLNFSTVGASLAFGLYYSWKVTLISLALSPLIAVVGAITMKVIMKFTKISEEAEKFLGSLMSDSVCNIRTVKSFGRSNQFLSKFGDKLDQLQIVNKEKFLKSAFLAGMSRGMIMFVEGIIFFIAALLFQDNQVTDSRAVFTATMSVIFAAMGVGQNTQFMPDMAKAKFAGAGIFDILESKSEDQLSLEAGGVIDQPLDGTIQFKNVSFRYPQREKMVLENLSFKIDNQKVALVGHSGSGKSTVVQLLMRYYEPESGQILINNKNIKQFNLYSLRKQIGLVSQQPSLFMGNVRQNIKYNSNCSQQDISRAIQVAHASKFIQEWDEGLNKEVGEKGGQISGGQKQRIALSRCLVKKPTLYLLDQFTSALDADTEKIVFNNLSPVLAKKTSVSIAHRLSTVEDCSLVLVFKDGRIIEQGSYKQLMQGKGHFYSLAQGK